VPVAAWRRPQVAMHPYTVWFYHIITTELYYIRGLELMKLIFAVLDVSLTMGLTRCYKTEGFLTFILN